MSEEVKRYSYGYVDDGNGNRYLGLIEKPDGNLVKHEDYESLLAERDALKKDAERYRWLRNPDQDVTLVLDKLTGHVPVDRFGGGGYPIYEYRAGEELDAAIDAALQES